jgi:hypothetical protein
LKNLIEHHLSKCCKEAFEGTPQHTAWETDLYNLRNSVVHNGASVDDKQSQQALAAAEQAIKWIEDRATLRAKPHGASDSTSTNVYIYPSVLQAVPGRGVAGCLERVVSGVPGRGYAGSRI